MRIVHHPDVATLMTCSAGSQPEALCAVVTSHLAMCSDCMRELSVLEEIGVGLFECSASDQNVTACSVAGTAETFDQIRGSNSEPVKGDVPWPLIPVIGHFLDAVQWTEVQPGISTYAIPLSSNAKGDLRLLRLEPRARLPEHGHVGEELALVLRGSCSDESGSFDVGDMSDLDDDMRHSVLAGPNGCIILLASETKPAFLAELAQSDS